MPTYECDKCGACCRGLLLVEAYQLDLLREPRLAQADTGRNDMPLVDVMADLEQEGRCLLIAGGLEHPCPFLGPDDRCSIYPTRPNVCVAMQAGDEQLPDRAARGRTCAAGADWQLIVAFPRSSFPSHPSIRCDFSIALFAPRRRFALFFCLVVPWQFPQLDRRRRFKMVELTRASHQLFSRPADERFETLHDLVAHCRQQKEASSRIKEVGREFIPVLHDSGLGLQINAHEPLRLTDWSFSQLCSIAGVAKETVNRLFPVTASHVLSETLAQRTDDETELQALVEGDDTVRAVNGERYKRLWNADLLAMVIEFATDFTPPQKGFNGATGLYAGQQDMFVFMIDPTGWTEIEDQTFAPGFFLWNSEVGRRTVGIQSFWFQSACANHIVWDAADVTEFTRTHAGKASRSLTGVREVLERLVEKRDQRKDAFARVISKAMNERYGDTIEDVEKHLAKSGFTQSLAKRAAEVAHQQGRFSIWSVVDALTQLSRDAKFAGTRVDADRKASKLLELVG